MSQTPNHRAGPAWLTGLALALALLVPIGVAAEIQPSSDILLPYFEVDLTDPDLGLTTLFAVVNDDKTAVDTVFTVYTNWGIPVLEIPLRLDPDQVRTFNLRDWIISGHLPGRTLSEEELSHLQAVLSGKPSPQDALYYGTEIEPGLAVGYVIVRAVGGTVHHDALWGDFYSVDPRNNYFQAETLVNIDRSQELCRPECKRHAIRFLNAGPLVHGTQILVWTGRRLAPSPTPQPLGAPVRASMSVYDEPGRHVEDRSLDLLSVEVLEVDHLALQPLFGWLDIRTDDPAYIAQHLHSTTDASAELHAWCLPEETVFEGPLITLQKLVNGEDADVPPGPSIPVGDAIEWQYVLTNEGSVPLTQVTVTDDAGFAVTCPRTELQPGESITCLAHSTAVGCQQTNIATVTALAPDGFTQVSASDPANYYGGYRAALQIEKMVNGQEADAPPGPTFQVGTPLQWAFLVTNSGDAPLTNVTVTDDAGLTVTCPKTTLQPGESMTCSASSVATEGQHSNTATVRGDSPCGPAAATASDAANYFGWHPQPTIDIEKLTNGQDADTEPGPAIPVGQAVQWTYVVTNTGDVPLSGILVTDDKGVAVTCPKTALEPGESMTCTGSGIAAACQYANIGTVLGTPPEGQGGSVTDLDPSHYFGQHHAAVTIEKLINGQEADTPPGPSLTVGSQVQWAYLVTNTGDVALHGVTVTDDQDDRDGVVACPKADLAPGESMTCTMSGTAVAGQHRNVGTVTAMPPCGAEVTASDPSHYLGVVPSIALEKLVNGEDADTPPGPSLLVGSPVLWTYVVTNTGDVTLSEILVTDDRGVAVTCPKVSLAAGESMTCTAGDTAVAGAYHNIGTVSGKSPQEVTVTAQDPAHYTGYRPAISLEKRVNGQDADTPPGPSIVVGSPVTWTYVVTNSGDARLTNVRVSDDRGVVVSCPKTTLEAGETMTCTASGTVTAGQYGNIGTAVGTPPTGPDVTATDPAYYFGVTPAISIEKRTNGEDADTPPGPSIKEGQTVTWTYLVTNAGDVTLTQVSVTDNRGVTVTCPKTTLAPAESMTCTGSGKAVVGQYSNIGTATGKPEGGSPVTAQDPSHYLGTACLQGCTPGYWKNHTDSWPPTGYSTSQKVKNVFSEAWRYPSGWATLHEALGFGGGSGVNGAAEILLRAAVAALLNSAHPAVNYPLVQSDVTSSVNVALASYDRDTMLALAAQLDADNNLGCPLH